MNKHVLVVAGVAWNTMVYVDAFPQPVEQSIFAERFHETVGSSGAGKSLNLGRLLPTTFFGLIGEDAYGQSVQEYFANQPVTFIHQPDPAGTKRHVNLMTPDGKRISIHVNHGTHDLAVDWQGVEKALETAVLITITGYNYTRPLLPIATKIKKPIWIDIHDYDGRNPHWDEFIEAATVIQLSSTNFPTYRQWMEQMVERGKEAIICTHGVDGATLLSAETGWLEVEAMPSNNVVDGNGAGDSFSAGVVYGRLSGKDWLTSLRYGALVAKMTVESSELYHPQLSPEFLKSLLATYPFDE